MIVVADTSPINYLVLIDEINVLAKMYGTVVIPDLVRKELLHPSTPATVTLWLRNAPAWLEVRTPTSSPDAILSELDPGERDAIVLAIELRAAQLLIDDREGRRHAERLGIPIMGTLGVLREAGALKLLDLRAAAARLRTTNFHVSPEVLDRLLEDLP